MDKWLEHCIFDADTSNTVISRPLTYMSLMSIMEAKRKSGEEENHQRQRHTLE